MHPDSAYFGRNTACRCGIDVGHHNLPAALNHKACGYSTNAVSTAYYYREVIACVVHRLAFIIGNNKLV